MRLLYFASVRERAGVAEEIVMPPGDVVDVASLIAWLRRRGGTAADALADLGCIRVAVNQDVASFDHPVAPSDEVAFFPPVTGG